MDLTTTAQPLRNFGELVGAIAYDDSKHVALMTRYALRIRSRGDTLAVAA
jgi:hypothetical protein